MFRRWSSGFGRCRRPAATRLPGVRRSRRRSRRRPKSSRGLRLLTPGSPRALAPQVSLEKTIADCTRESLRDSAKAKERADTLGKLPGFWPRSAMSRADVHAVVVRNGIALHAPVELDLGRTTLLANRAQRRALRALYSACAIPGCAVRYSRCKLHHVIWWRNGGRTDLDNLLPVCTHHHTKVHDAGWNLRLGPQRQLTITFLDGTIHNPAHPTAERPEGSRPSCHNEPHDGVSDRLRRSISSSTEWDRQHRFEIIDRLLCGQHLDRVMPIALAGLRLMPRSSRNTHLLRSDLGSRAGQLVELGSRASGSRPCSIRSRGRIAPSRRRRRVGCVTSPIVRRHVVREASGDVARLRSPGRAPSPSRGAPIRRACRARRGRAPGGRAPRIRQRTAASNSTASTWLALDQRPRVRVRIAAVDGADEVDRQPVRCARSR